MTDKKLFVFDLDGTLVDSVQDIADAMNFILSKHGMPVKALSHYRQLVGKGTANMVEKTVCGTGLNVDLLHSQFQAHYQEHFLNKTMPFPGMYDCLRRVSDSPHAIAVLSNKQYSLVEKTLKRLFDDIKFDYVLGLTDPVLAKPNPENLKSLIAKAGCIEAYMIGDTAIDMETAKNANSMSVAVLWGYSSVEQLVATEPHLIFEKQSEFISWFEQNA